MHLGLTNVHVDTTNWWTNHFCTRSGYSSGMNLAKQCLVEIFWTADVFVLFGFFFNRNWLFYQTTSLEDLGKNLMCFSITQNANAPNAMKHILTKTLCTSLVHIPFVLQFVIPRHVSNVQVEGELWLTIALVGIVIFIR